MIRRIEEIIKDMDIGTAGYDVAIALLHELETEWTVFGTYTADVEMWAVVVKADSLQEALKLAVARQLEVLHEAGDVAVEADDLDVMTALRGRHEQPEELWQSARGDEV